MIREYEIIRIAQNIAIKAHKDQFDKGGKPYIEHPLRVANKGTYKFRQSIIALLHDVVEDSEYEFNDLLAEGIPEDVISALKLLTRDFNIPYEEYIDKLLESNDIDAIMVKKYDLEDNMDITRLPELTESDFKRLQKYHTQYKRIVEYLKPYNK